MTDAMDDVEEDFDDETRWMVVIGEGPSEAYRDAGRGSAATCLAPDDAKRTR
jgi:hypothetical protein